jgi:hypothetical protein
MKKVLQTILLAAIWTITATAVPATPIFQVDKITTVGAPYRGDIWTLSVSGPISRTVTYTGVPDDEVGSNTDNLINKWTAAINSDPVMGGFLTAVAGSAMITLTADIPDTPFFSTVSVIEFSEFDFNEDPDLAVSVMTIVSVPDNIPEPTTLAIVGLGLVGLGVMRRRWSA